MNRNNIGLKDTNGKEICHGDKVEFLGKIGEVVYCCSAFGIIFNDNIDWEGIAEEIPKVTGCNNSLYACKNDNFISFWEIMWNFNDEENVVSMVKVVE